LNGSNNEEDDGEEEDDDDEEKEEHEDVPFAKERCPPRQKSRVERLKAKVEPLST